MPTLTLTNEQVIELIKQLPPDQQEKLVQDLIRQQWPTWTDLSRHGQTGARAAAGQHGLDWDSSTADAREAFIDDLVHQDR